MQSMTKFCAVTIFWLECKCLLWFTYHNS